MSFAPDDPNDGSFNPDAEDPNSNPEDDFVNAVLDQVTVLMQTIITGDLPGVVMTNGNWVDDIDITVQVKAIDGLGGTLALTTIDEVRSVAPFLPVKATICIDSADLANPNLDRIILHQYLHALGFGFTDNDPTTTTAWVAIACCTWCTIWCWWFATLSRMSGWIWSTGSISRGMVQS